jgi:hypothetical protein
VQGFPAVLTSFIGRAGPVREVARVLARQQLSPFLIPDSACVC